MTKKEMVASIPKDKGKILNLWGHAQIDYYSTKTSSTVSDKIKYNDLQRKTMNEIGSLALDNYGSSNAELNSLIAHKFSEYSQFLHFWLMDVGIDSDKWNEVEDFFHETRIKYGTRIVFKNT